jgi:hypothetical protein
VPELLDLGHDEGGALVLREPTDVVDQLAQVAVALHLLGQAGRGSRAKLRRQRAPIWGNRSRRTQMKARTALLSAALCAAVAAAPAKAGAQEPAGLTQVVPVTGKSKSGKQFTGSCAIDRFRSSSGRLVAVGTLAAAWASVAWPSAG